MAAPLNTCTTIEQRGLVRFLWAKDRAAKDSHKEMLPMYVEHCLSRQQSIIGCRSSRKGGQVSKTNIDSGFGRPVEIATPVTLRCVEDIIRADRRVTIDAVATTICCSHGQTYNMMRERLGFQKVCSPWVPRQLKPQHKAREWACHCIISSATRTKRTTCFPGSSLVMSFGAPL